MNNGLLILDFGSQLTQLIARRLRELGVYCEILPHYTSIDKIRELNPKGIILSGGPQSVYDSSSPKCEIESLRSLSPVMGICYGMQLIAHQLGGKVISADHREYGRQLVEWTNSPSWGSQHNVWMSHGDIVVSAPPGLKIVARSKSGHAAAMEGNGYFAVQFHPEVSHTEFGTEILEHFVQVTNVARDWTPITIKEKLLNDIKEKLGAKDQVLVALSGGVDSTVVAKLLTNAIGAERVHCVFVNNGLLRMNEDVEVMRRYRELGLNVQLVDAQELFLNQLAGKTDPEEKRKTIGRVFIEVFDEAVKTMNQPIKWLAQGTLYPDVIESVSASGESVTIKSHHNVGGLPDKMNMRLIEPLRELFKDEVRLIGKELGLSQEVTGRHPFPGPGLAIRILGEINSQSLNILKKADAIYIEELKKHNIYDQIWQAFAVLLPILTVGVQGDHRTYEKVLALRAVTSSDGMTADWFEFSHKILSTISNRITNEVQGINRVVYDVTSKPPGTIEWE